MHDIARIIRKVRDEGAWPWELANEEGYTGLDGPGGLRKALSAEGLVSRHTPNYPGRFPGFEGGKWYIWPLTEEAAQKWDLPRDISLYLPKGLLEPVDGGYRMPDGRVFVSNWNEELYWGGDEYAVACGARAAIGELVEGYEHDGHGDLSFCRGVVPSRYVPIERYRAKQRLPAMPDGEYELAIGEGIPAGSPLLETRMARKARAKLRSGLEEAPDMARWISVGKKEKLPKTFDSVFFFSEGDGACVGYYDGWGWYNELRLDADDCSPMPMGDVSHWMPIDWPEPPKEGEDGEEI